MSKRQKKTAEERQVEIESARIFGKHVSREKGYLLLAVTLVACALPMVLGVRMWDQILRSCPADSSAPMGRTIPCPAGWWYLACRA